MDIPPSGCDPSPPPPADSPLRTAEESLPALSATPPLPIDWSQEIPDWPVGHQEKTAACVGWTLADGLLHAYFRRKNLLGVGERLSPRYLWLTSIVNSHISPKLPTPINPFAGTTIAGALEIASRFGCLKEDSSGNRWEGTSLPTGFQFPTPFVIPDARIKWLGLDHPLWRRWLTSQGPIAVRIALDANFVGANNVSHTLDDYVPFDGSGHAVLLVGHKSNKDFIIRNSWGTVWGDNGYATATPGYLKKAVTEAWGVRT